MAGKRLEIEGAGHLVLGRHRDESIVLGIDGEVIAVVTIVNIRGGRVRLGILAPPHIQVHRREIWEAIERDKAAAAAGGAT